MHCAKAEREWASRYWTGIRGRQVDNKRGKARSPQVDWTSPPGTYKTTYSPSIALAGKKQCSVSLACRFFRLNRLVWAPLGDLGVCESGNVGGVELLELNRGAPAQGAVASLPVMEDLQVLKDRIGELDASGPSPAVQEFGLHPGPERLDDGVVVGVTDGAHRGQQAGLLGALGERPRGVSGGFNGRCNTPSTGGVDGTTTGLGDDREAADAVAWPAAGGAA